ncbi:MAG: tripartite tricarboxylate transporter substrate binding protein [Betaproteobacteria bacterium]|nr:tripartite tricarboxylate transporter substrate binding protein [Betaproteobacteria bacterium]
MSLLNRTRCLLCAALIAVPAGAALAQGGYPGKPVRVIVPSSPGGGTDILTRQLTSGLAERLGQPVVVDNRPGAGSIIGNDLVARAAPDGYTLLMGISTLAILPSTKKKLPYDALKDLAPITQVIAAPNILVVHPSLPARSVKELISFARRRPNEINYASAGTGTNPHLSMELFLSMTNVKMVHIPYKGLGPALIDLLAGHVVAATATMLSGLPHVRSGRLRGLATTGARRSSALPELPTVAEAGVPGYEAVQWYGLFAPAGTPRETIAKLHEAMTAVLRSPAVAQKLVADGADAVANTPEEFARVLRAETGKWAKVVRAAGIKPE